MEALEFREIPNLPGYFVSRCGKIGSLRTGLFKIKATPPNTYGYPNFSININGKPGLVRVHRVVAKVFIPKVEGKLFVNHINNIRTDNRVENLEGVTPRENNEHYWNTMKSVPRGQDGRSKLSHDQVREARRLHEQGWSYVKISQHFGVHDSTINYLVNRKTWRNLN